MFSFFLAVFMGVAQAERTPVTVYVNGTPVDGLKSYEFKQVDIRFDKTGDISHEKFFSVRMGFGDRLADIDNSRFTLMPQDIVFTKIGMDQFSFLPTNS